ncbi:MAG: glycosyltransferase family 2 protein [Thermodesulfobacteriota bacterium]
MTVAILLSTYNGERYLAEQLGSIADQTYRDLRLFVRDDGSTDRTRDLIEQARRHGMVQRFEIGENIGIFSSFFYLLAAADEDCSYYAFADQDDWWYPDKVETAVAALQKVDDRFPALYCGRLACVDRNLAPLCLSPVPCRPLGLANALVENVASGCTMVINRAARRLLLQTRPEWCLFHDWWSYLVISALGRVIYDERPLIKYRLHGDNDTGAPRSFAHGMVRRLRRFLGEDKQTFKVHRQALEFVSRCGPLLSGENRRIAENFVASKKSRASRIRYSLRKEVYRQQLVDDLLLRLLIWADRY